MFRLKFLSLLAATCCAGLAVAPASLAHHSAIAFDSNQEMTVTGTVTNFVWRNPHLSISLEVAGSNGETELWRIEGGGTTEMVNMGFDRNSLSEGDKITVSINPLKTGKPGGLLQGLTLANGKSFGMDAYENPAAEPAVREIPSLMAYVPAPAGETWQQREKRTRPKKLPLVSDGEGSVGPGALDPDNLNKPRPKPPFDLTGTWAFRGEDDFRASYGSYEFKPHPEFTEKGKKIYAEYLSYAKEGKRYTEPTAFCYPAGMPRMMTRYGALMMLQYPTAIYMLSRLNNEYRVIYLDGRARQAANIRDPNWGGESLGRWEGDTLVVQSEGFTDENHLMQQGVFAGDQLKITERIRMLNDGNTLMFEYTFVDPEHWKGEWKHTKFHDRFLGADVKEANCLLEDNRALPGMTNN